MRLTVPPSFETQTEPPPNASDYGLIPTLIRARRRFVCGFTRVTAPVVREPTQTLPAPYVAPKGLPLTASRQTMRPVAGSTRTKRLSIRSVTHSAPPPGRTNEAETPTCTCDGAARSAATTSRVTTTLNYITTRLL